MIYDLGFLFHQFIEPLPDTFKEWQVQVAKFFPYIYDTKVLSNDTTKFNRKFERTELGFVYDRCINDKKLCNHIKFEFDSSQKGVFQTYEKT